MLKIETKVTDHEYELILHGHCDTAPKGEDLVCAGASALCLAMTQVLEENRGGLADEPTLKINEGDCELKWKPTPEAEAALRNCLYTVVTGLKVLQHNNPEAIEITEKK